MAELQNENRNKTQVKRLCHRKICRAVGSPAPLRFQVPTALIWTMLLYLKATSVVVLQFKRKRLLYTNENKNKTQKTSHLNSRVAYEISIQSRNFYKQEDKFYGKILLVPAAAVIDFRFLSINFCLKKYWQFHRSIEMQMREKKTNSDI